MKQHPGADRSRRCRWPMAAAAAAAARTAGGRRVAVFPTSAVRVHDAPWTAAGPARRARRTAAHHIASIKNRPGEHIKNDGRCLSLSFSGPESRQRRGGHQTRLPSIKNRPGNTKPQLDLRVLAQHTPTAPVLPPPSRFSSHGLVWPSGPRHLRTDWHRPLHLSFRHCRWA